MMPTSTTAPQVTVESLARRQRNQRLLDLLAEITHRALLAPSGRAAREVLAEWGFPETSVGHLDVGYFPDPAFVAWELQRRGVLTSEAEGAAVLSPTWSGRVVGPWRSPRGRILTFFAWAPESADRDGRYVFGPGSRPPALFSQDRPAARRSGHLWLVEGLLDVLLAVWLGMEDVAGMGGPFWLLSVQVLAQLAASGIRQLTLMPADDEEGRRDVLTVLQNADRVTRPAVDVFVVDPAMMAGARDLGELAQRRATQVLTGVEAWRMEGNVYRVAMVPLQ